MSTPREKDPPRSPLGEAIDSRIRELGTTLTRLAADADVSRETLRTWRLGINKPQRKPALRLDAALDWNPGSTYATAEGGQPTICFEAENEAERRIMAMQHVPAEKKRQIIKRIRANQEAALEEAQALDELARHRDRREGRNTA